MPRPALVLIGVLAYLALALGARTLLHWRRTGSTGFRGVSGRPGSAAWWGGALFVVALAGSVAAPGLALAGVERVWGGDRALDAAAVAALAVGAALLWWAQGAMGASWRIGVDEAERTALVTHGPFAWVRNPIFTGLIVSGAGLVLALPTTTSVLTLAALIAAVELQVRAVEEPYLLRAQAGYRAYAARVGRFVPGVGKL